MIHYKQELQNLQQLAMTMSFEPLMQHFDALEQQLLAQQQYAEVCNLYYHRLSLYYLHGLTVNSVQLLIDKKPFIVQHAHKEDRLLIRKETLFILESLGYRDQYYESMMAFYQEGVTLHIPSLVCDALNALGYHFFTMRDLQLAERYFQECIDYSEQHTTLMHNYGYSRALLNIAHMYMVKDDLTSTQYYLNRFEQAEILKIPAILAVYYYIQMKVAQKKHDYPTAIHYANEVLALDIEHIYWITISHILLEMASLFEEINELEIAVSILERFKQFIANYNSYQVTQLSLACKYDLEQTLLLETLQEDALTGVLNRAGFEQAVAPLLQQADNHWRLFAILDIDYFKQINDTHGHLVGDEVLKELSRRAIRCNKSKRHFFGRYGGDEFYYYIEAPTKEQLILEVEHFYTQLIEQPFAFEELAFPLSISCGAVYGWNEVQSFVEWVACADKTLYAVKAQGRGHLQLQSFQDVQTERLI